MKRFRGLRLVLFFVICSFMQPVLTYSEEQLPVISMKSGVPGRPLPDGCVTSGRALPVVEYNGGFFVPLSYRDNRFSTCIAIYSPDRDLIGSFEVSGARYIERAEINAAENVVAFYGQAGKSITVPLEKIRSVPIVHNGTPNTLKAPDGCSRGPLTIYRGDKRYVPFSFDDNRMSINVAGYNKEGKQVSQREFSKIRYIDRVTVDLNAETISFFGDSYKDIPLTIPWNSLSPDPKCFIVDSKEVPEPPSGSKATEGMPGLRLEELVYWPFSFKDNRQGINIVGYDSDGDIAIQLEVPGTRNIEKIEADELAETLTFIGKGSKSATVPWDKLRPERTCVVVESRFVPKPPSGFSDVGRNIPGVRLDGITYWPFSFRDNRSGVNIVGYDAAGNIVSQMEVSGARYIDRVVVKEKTETVTFFGQSDKTVTVSFSKLRGEK